MQGKTSLEQLWAGCDTILLVMVFILLGVVWYSNNRAAPAQERDAAKKRDASTLQLRAPLPPDPVDGIRVALERQRMNSIARSMVDSGWDESPASPAMDMREDGKTCEVFFTLPEGIVEDSVRVTVAGDVLTLMMKDDDTGRLYLQRIRIPFGIDRSDTLQTVISNDVLRVRVCPCPAGG